MNEEAIRQIVRDEMARNYTSGSPDIPPHEHNGTDGLNLDPKNINNFFSIPAGAKKYLNPDTGLYSYGFGSNMVLVQRSATNGEQYINDNTVPVIPIPIVVGNGRISGKPQGEFQGGYAPEGTILFFNNGVTGELWVKFGDGWFGVDMPLTA